jgi:alpha-glucosidase
VEEQEDDPASTLSLYRRALALRGDLQVPEQLEWVATEAADVIRFRRPHGWEVVMNFGTAPVDLPDGEVLVASGPLDEGRLPGETAVWLRQ